MQQPEKIHNFSHYVKPLAIWIQQQSIIFPLQYFILHTIDYYG